VNTHYESASEDRQAFSDVSVTRPEPKAHMPIAEGPCIEC